MKHTKEEKKWVTLKTRKEYFKCFPTGKREIDNETLRAEALKQALDIRKFEIEMYWKRATYFWGFLIVTYAGYFTVYGSKIDEDKKPLILFIISCLGLSFSLSWFLVNKGSKYWQNNWERHVDMLENGIMGPLYKTVLVEKRVDRKLSFITDADNYSVSKINQILSFYLILLWLLLLVFNLFKSINLYFKSILNEPYEIPNWVYNFPFEIILFSLLTLVFVYNLLKEGKSKDFNGRSKEETHFLLREKVLMDKESSEVIKKKKRS